MMALMTPLEIKATQQNMLGTTDLSETERQKTPGSLYHI